MSQADLPVDNAAQPLEQPRDRPPEQPTGHRRLHPMTPFARGWRVVAVMVAVVGQDALRRPDFMQLLLTAAVIVPIAAVYGFLSWRFTSFWIDEHGDLQLHTGVLMRRERRVTLSRLQAVDVVRPLVARLLGLAELRLEVAGGSSSEAPLAYLSEDSAQRLRAELLARAAGIDSHTPEAPEYVLTSVPPSRLAAALLLSGATVAGVLAVIAFTTAATLTGEWGLLGPVVPIVLGVGGAFVTQFTSQFDFTLAESPDGLRLRRGLLETRAQTVPPGRVQAVRLAQPLLWRRPDWVRLQVNVAGYGGAGQEQQATSLLLPVAPRPIALAVLGRVFPGVDVGAVPVQPVPRRARWRQPVSWRGLACGADDAVFVSRRGVLRRELDVVPHVRAQSVRVTQGPWERRLRLASVHLDTTPGPVQADAWLRDAAEARAICEAQAQRSRRARDAAAPERWMTQVSESTRGEGA